MSYVIKEAINAQNIKEQEYGIDAEKIQFGNFTSCLGIVAVKSDRKLIGIHLVIVDKNDQPFKDTDVQTVTNLIGSDPQEVLFIGHVGIWEQNLVGAYAKLKAELKPIKALDLGDGVYQAVIKSNGILINEVK